MLALSLPLVAVLLAAPAPTPTGTATHAPAEDTARAHHEQGRGSFAAGRYEIAIAQYRRAYELKADPSFLFDIAEAYRGLGVAERAVFFYRRYLTTHDNPPNRPEVEKQIALLDPAPAADVVTAPRAQTDSLALGATAPVHTVSDRERSVIGRWWFWTAVGALAAAGATVAILAASKSGSGGDVPPTQLGNARIEF